VTGDDNPSTDAETTAFRRYLRAKRTVDDRALDRRLVGLFRERLADRAAVAEDRFASSKPGLASAR